MPNRFNPLDEARRLARGFVTGVTEGPRTLGRALGTAIVSPFETRRLQQEARTTAQVQDILGRRGRQALARGDAQSRRIFQQSQRVGQRETEQQQRLGERFRGAERQAIGGGFRTGLTAIGGTAPLKLLAPSLGIGGALGGVGAALRDEDVAAGVGRGAGEAVKFAGLNRLTTPFFDPVIRAAGGGILGRVAGRGLAGAATNLVEDEVFTRLSEGRAPTKGERLFSAGVGAVAGQLPGDLEERIEVTDPKKATKFVRDIKGRFAKTNKQVKKAKFISELPDLGKNKQLTQVGPRRFRVTDKTLAGGFIGGIEIETDEEGRITGTSFNPEGALAGLVFVGGVKAVRAGGGRFSLDNLKTTDDVIGLIKQQAKGADELIKQERRGKITFEQTREAAQKLGFSTEEIFKKRPGRALNAEQLVAAGDLLKTTSERAARLSNQFNAAKTTGQATDVMRLQLLDAMNEQSLVMSKVLGAEAEAGRALSAIKILKQTVTDPTNAGIRKVIRRFGGEENIDNILKRYNELLTEDPESAFRYLRTLNKSNFGDKLTEYWYNSILSSPATHLINTISNALATLTSPVERLFSAAVDVPVAAIQKRPRARFFGEATRDLIGTRSGVTEGVQKALQIIKKGYTAEDVVKLELRRPQAIRGPLGAVINIPSRFLIASDVFFKSINQSAALHAQAYRMARQQGKRGKNLINTYADLVANPPPQLINRAGKIAKYRVFQKEAGPFIQAVAGLRKKLRVGGTDGGTDGGIEPLRFVIPFIETPVNLLKFGFERTPAGALTAFGKEGADVSDQLGKALMGSFVAASIATAASEGKLTGAGPKNRKDRDRLFRAGWQPFSIKIGDRWVSYQRLEPFNQVFTQIATIFDEFVENEAPTSDKIQNVAVALGRNLVDQSYLAGLSDVLNAVNDPERYGGNVLERFAGSLVPASSALRTATRAIDPTVRDPQGIQEAIQATIPGLSQQVRAKETSFGEPIVREGGAVRQAFPIRFTTETGDVANIRQNIRREEGIRDAKKAIKNDQEPRGIDQPTSNVLKAESVLSQISAIPKSDRVGRQRAITSLKQAGKLTPEVQRLVTRIGEMSKAGLSVRDRELVFFGGQFRAEKLNEILGSLQSKDSKRRKLATLRKFGLITDLHVQQAIQLKSQFRR